MRLRIKLTNNRYLYVSIFFICINLYIAIFNPVISIVEKVILVSLSLSLSFFAYNLKRTIDEKSTGESFTLSRGQKLIIEILVLISLFLDLFYAPFTPLMN